MQDLLRWARGPFFGLGFVALLVGCLSYARDYAVPLAIAVLIWFLINALANALMRAPAIGQALPYWLAKTVAVLVMGGTLVLVAQTVARNVGELSTGVSTEGDVILARLEGLAARLGIDVSIRPSDVYDTFEIDVIASQVLSTAQGLISDASLVFLYVLFLLADERFFGAKLDALMPDAARRDRLRLALDRIATETRLYLWLMSLISLGVALVTYATCVAVGMAGAGFWGFLAFALNFIPTIGSILAVVLPTVYGLLTLNDPVMLVVLVSVLAGTQFVAGEVVLPRVMGDRLNLSSVVILLVLVIWGAMWGPAGMFLAIPITVILTLVCARFETTRPIAVLLSKKGQVPLV